MMMLAWHSWSTLSVPTVRYVFDYRDYQITQIVFTVEGLRFLTKHVDGWFHLMDARADSSQSINENQRK